MKKCLLLIIICSMLTGCWDRHELNQLGIVGAFGLDLDPATGNIKVFTEILNPQILKKEGTPPNSSPTQLEITTGVTLFEAFRNISKQFDRIAYFSHTRVIIISEDLAKEGLLPYIDFFARSDQIRPLVRIIIAKNTSPLQLLSTTSGMENFQAYYLRSIINHDTQNSQSINVTLLDFIKTMSGEGINPIAGVMQIIEQPSPPDKNDKTAPKAVIFSGTAVFHKDKLVGYMNEQETIGLNWLREKTTDGYINIPFPPGEDTFIVAEIKQASSRIKPQLENGEIHFLIEIQTEGDIIETSSSSNISKLEILRMVETALENEIKKDVSSTIDAAQNQFHTDILGFGRALYRNYPKEWKTIKGDWETIFPAVKYEIQVTARLKRHGLVNKPLSLGNE
ncbi:MAG: hypothetical protein H6Q73_2270 [Firmicutes bacterium]|nr:hypothetical protein [Bacillota bacterium]